MAAPPSNDVIYHVTDQLKDRHPYNPTGGFMAQRDKDKGKVFNGFGKEGLDTLLAALGDEEKEDKQKVVALKWLLTHSVAAEKKIVLLRKGIVALLSNLIMSRPIPEIEFLCCKVLRSLAILAQGCCIIVKRGGLKALQTVVSDRENLAAREEARIASLEAISQLSSRWDGRSWILGMVVPDALELVGEETEGAALEDQEALAQGTIDAIVSVLEADASSKPLVYWALKSLENLTLADRGMQFALIGGALRSVTTVLERFTKNDEWVFSSQPMDADTVNHAVTVAWNIGMDDVGKEEAMTLPLIPHIVGKLMHFVLQTKESHASLKAALVGCVCALMIHAPMKESACTPLTTVREDGSVNLLDLIVKLLRQANELHQPLHQADKKGKPLPFTKPTLEEASAVVKNCVQSIRLIVELEKARSHLKDVVPEADWELRRQLFSQTAYEQEFNVKK